MWVDYMLINYVSRNLLQCAWKQNCNFSERKRETFFHYKMKVLNNKQNTSFFSTYTKLWIIYDIFFTLSQYNVLLLLLCFFLWCEMIPFAVLPQSVWFFFWLPTLCSWLYILFSAMVHGKIIIINHVCTLSQAPTSGSTLRSWCLAV